MPPKLGAKKVGLKAAAEKLGSKRGRGVSLSNLVELLEEGLTNQDISRELDERLDVHTPYGKLIGRLDLPAADGSGTFPWSFANPFALVWLLCQLSAGYTRFFIKSLGSRVGRLVLYTDGCTPGSKIVAWRQREVCCWYWTVADFPAWFRAKEHGGWLPFGFMRTEAQKLLDGDLSGVCKHVLRQFFGKQTFNFKEGMRLPGEQQYLLRLELRAFLQDGLAHKQVASIKGAGGLICCLNCTNIMNCNPDEIAEDPDLHHYSTAKPKDFKRQTHSFFYLCCDRLMAAHGIVTNGEFELMEKSWGITFNPDSVVYDIELRSIYSVPEHSYHDPMHVLVASGGVAPHELNAFLLHAVYVHSLDLGYLDEWVQSLKLPVCFPKNFFSHRQPCNPAITRMGWLALVRQNKTNKQTKQNKTNKRRAGLWVLWCVRVFCQGQLQESRWGAPQSVRIRVPRGCNRGVYVF